MIERVQTLLQPTGMKSLGEVSINLPDVLAEALRKIFSFDVGGCNELEGDKIFRSLERFWNAAQSEDMCIVYFRDDKLLADECWQVMTPISGTEDVLELIANQLGSRPRPLVTPSRMEASNDLASGKGIIGWFDLDTPSFIFKQSTPLFRLCDLMGKNYGDLPQLNRNLTYMPPVGETQSVAIAQMSMLARAWGHPVETRWNDQVVVVPVAGSPTITSAVS